MEAKSKTKLKVKKLSKKDDKSVEMKRYKWKAVYSITE